MSRVRRVSFVVRVVQDGHGQLNGVVEQVATGAKEPFTGMEVIGEVIVRMLRHETVLPLADSGAPLASAPPRLGKRPRGRSAHRESTD